MLANFNAYSNLQLGKYGDKTAQEVRFGVEYTLPHSEVYIEHNTVLSSNVPVGANIIGANAMSPKWNEFCAYAGGFWIPRKYNSEYYESQNKNYGVRYGIMYKNIYIERYNNMETVAGLKVRF
jgi:hypothetical protein